MNSYVQSNCYDPRSPEPFYLPLVIAEPFEVQDGEQGQEEAKACWKTRRGRSRWREGCRTSSQRSARWWCTQGQHCNASAGGSIQDEAWWRRRRRWRDASATAPLCAAAATTASNPLRDAAPTNASHDPSKDGGPAGRNQQAWRSRARTVCRRFEGGLTGKHISLALRMSMFFQLRFRRSLGSQLLMILRHLSWRRLEDQGEVSVVVADMCSSRSSTWGLLPLYHGDLRPDRLLGTQMLSGATICTTAMTEPRQGLPRRSSLVSGCEYLLCL
jgi:hypothetical protein